MNVNFILHVDKKQPHDLDIDECKNRSGRNLILLNVMDKKCTLKMK